MSRQYFEDMTVEPLDIANSVVNFLTAELALFPNTSQITIPTTDPRPGKVWKLTAGGIWTPPGSGTLTITPRWGTSTAGISLGASVAQALAVSAAASAWWLEMMIMCRAIGLDGLFSTFIAQGRFNAEGVTATVSSVNNILFGGTQSAVCNPTLGGAFIGMTFSTTGATMTPQIVTLQSLN